MAWIYGLVALGGALINNYSSGKAADEQRQAEEAAGVRQQVADRKAQARLENEQMQAYPGVSRLRSIVANPHSFSPMQFDQMEQGHRSATNLVRSSPLNSSGRAVTAAIRNSDTNLRNQFTQQNEQRADQAAGNLATGYFNAGRDATNIDLSMGTSGAASARNIGKINADETASQGDNYSSLIGTIGGVIASNKKKTTTDDTIGRPSSYTKPEGTYGNRDYSGGVERM